MRLAALFVATFGLVTPVRAQNAPAPPRNAQAPVFATPPAPTPTRVAGSPTSVTYQSVNPKLSYRVEPVDSQRVRLGGWESAGFTINVDAVPLDPAATIDTTAEQARRSQSRTRITSEGEATSKTVGPLRVDSVEMEFVNGRGYLTLTNPRPNP